MAMAGILVSAITFVFPSQTLAEDERPTADTAATPPSAEELVAIFGLEGLLKILAFQRIGPLNLNLHIRSVGMDAAGKTLHHRYRVSEDFHFELNNVRMLRIESTCLSSPSRGLLPEGAIFEFHYERASGEDLGSYAINEKICDDYVVAYRAALPSPEESLQMYTAQFTPRRINDEIAYATAAASGTHLRSTFHIDSETPFSLDRMQVEHVADACRNSPWRIFVLMPITIEFIYTRPDGEELGRFPFDKTTCEAHDDAR
jgi:hypothetical protein